MRELLLFDDTILHEAWNYSDRPRTVLIFDVWKPQLTEEERALVSAMFQAIDDYGAGGTAWGWPLDVTRYADCVALAAYVAEKQNCRPEQVIFANGQVSAPDAVLTWEQLVDDAYHSRVQLWSDGFYRTPKIHYDKHTLTGRPFYYFAYGAACTEVAIDTLTGENRVLKVDILHDVGTSINPAIDIGQIEGGFIQGMGWLTTEQLVWNDKGYLSTHAPSTYKIPATGDVPEHFRIELWPEPNPEDNVFRSKAVGEPPFMLAISVWEALRDAVAAARGDRQVQLDAPATAENVLKALRG